MAPFPLYYYTDQRHPGCDCYNLFKDKLRLDVLFNESQGESYLTYMYVNKKLGYI